MPPQTRYPSNSKPSGTNFLQPNPEVSTPSKKWHCQLDTRPSTHEPVGGVSYSHHNTEHSKYLYKEPTDY